VEPCKTLVKIGPVDGVAGATWSSCRGRTNFLEGLFAPSEWKFEAITGLWCPSMSWAARALHWLGEWVCVHPSWAPARESAGGECTYPGPKGSGKTAETQSCWG